jgi:hypothetical protein
MVLASGQEPYLLKARASLLARLSRHGWRTWRRSLALLKSGEAEAMQQAGGLQIRPGTPLRSHSSF